MAETNGTTPDWDVLPKMAPYFDRHLLFPLLNNMEDSPDKDKAIFSLLKDSAMVDYVGDTEARIKGLDAPPPEYAQRRQATLEKRDRLEQQSNKVLDLLDNEEVVNNLRADKEANLKFLETDYAVKPEDIAAVYDYGRFMYESGDYGQASHALQRFRILVWLILSPLSLT